MGSRHRGISQAGRTAFGSGGGGGGGTCRPLSALFYVDKYTTIPDVAQDGSICKPFKTLAQVADLAATPDYAGWWITVELVPASYAGCTFDDNGGQYVEIRGNQAFISSPIIVGAHEVVTLDQLGFLAASGVQYESDSGTATFINLRDCWSAVDGGFTVGPKPGGTDDGLCHVWVAGTWSNVGRTFEDGSYCVVADVVASGDVELTNCRSEAEFVTGRKVSTSNGVYFTRNGGVTITAAEDTDEAPITLFVMRDTWFEHDVTLVRATGTADALAGVDAETQFSLDLRTVVLTDVTLVLESVGGSAACVPLSNVTYIDGNTTVAPGDQNGSACAPFADPQAAADATAQFGTLMLVGDNYAVTPLVLTGKSITIQGFSSTNINALNVSGSGSNLEISNCIGVDIDLEDDVKARNCDFSSLQAATLTAYDCNLSGLILTSDGNIFNCACAVVQFGNLRAENCALNDDITLTGGGPHYLSGCTFGSGVSIDGTGADILVLDPFTYDQFLRQAVAVTDLTIRIAEPAVLQYTTLTNASEDLTVAAVDLNKSILMDRATGQTLTVKTHAHQALQVGIQVPITTVNDGQTTIAAEGGVTIHVDALYALKLRAKWSKALLEQLDQDVWLLTGDLELA